MITVKFIKIRIVSKTIQHFLIEELGQNQCFSCTFSRKYCGTETLTCELPTAILEYEELNVSDVIGSPSGVDLMTFTPFFDISICLKVPSSPAANKPSLWSDRQSKAPEDMGVGKLTLLVVRSIGQTEVMNEIYKQS